MGKYTITKTVITEYVVSDVVKDFSTYNKVWRKVREHAQYRGFECFMCERDFEDGESIGLMLTDKGNKVLCVGCAEQIIKDKGE